MRTPRPVPPCDFMIFGGTCDPTTVRTPRPALYLRDQAGLHHWHDSGRVPRVYPAGTDGPADAGTPIERDGRRRQEEAA